MDPRRSHVGGVEMLYSLDGRLITQVPYREEFDLWSSRLSQDQLDSIREELQSMIEGREVCTAGWMPGNDWRGTVFQPIYEDACRGSRDQAAQCFGLLVWEAFMRHPDNWSSGRFEKDGVPIGSRTYFRIEV